jgi:REP element-mobilizing transposase RayT
MILRKYYLKNYYVFITTVTRDNQPIFSQEKFCDILVENLKFYRDKFRFKLLGYVIMLDHFHGIFLPCSKGNISQIMRDWKSYTSYQINRLRNTKGQLWQKDFYEHTIRNKEDFREKLNYIHNNPIKAGLVEKLEDYKYSSYRNYYLNDNSIIYIDKIYF